MFNFNNWMLSKKIKMGFGVVLALMVVVAAIGEWGLTKAGHGYDEYRATARVRNSLARVDSAAFAFRLSMRTFNETGDQKHVKSFGERFETAGKSIEEAKTRCSTEVPPGALRDECLADLESVGKMMAEYRTGSDKVFELRTKRDSQVGTLGQIGVDIEKEVASVMHSAAAGSDVQVTRLAAEAIRELLLMRLYVVKFLDEGDDKYFETAKEQNLALIKHLKSLDSLLQAADSKRSVNAARASAAEYDKLAAELVGEIHEINKITHENFDIVGPKLSASIEEMQLDMKDRQDALGERVQASNRQATMISLLSTVVALVLGVLLAWKIGAAIIGPLREMSSVIAQVAKGDF
ncbi:MAG: hypothetical protein IT350_20200, partial [Deltaproteobacteria bacterium]|nr:hypothetical protein [Deltaproteobacteria bacterium]